MAAGRCHVEPSAAWGWRGCSKVGAIRETVGCQQPLWSREAEITQLRGADGSAAAGDRLCQHAEWAVRAAAGGGDFSGLPRPRTLSSPSTYISSSGSPSMAQGF